MTQNIKTTEKTDATKSSVSSIVYKFENTFLNVLLSIFPEKRKRIFRKTYIAIYTITIMVVIFTISPSFVNFSLISILFSKGTLNLNGKI